MKNAFLILMLSIAPLFASAQEADAAVDSAKIGKVWKFRPLPVVGYNSDLGWELGAMCTFLCYAEGRTSVSDYMHRINFEGSYSFKGSASLYALYDSKYLIPKTRFTATVAYTESPIRNFYGFNGAASPYHTVLHRNEGIAFYSFKRNTVRVMTNFQGTIKGPFKWAAGLAFWHYDLGNITLKKYRENADFSLYNLYRKYGVITENEATGGSHLELRTELVFDTRDHESIPSRGIWVGVMAYGSPDMFGSRGNGRNGRGDYLKMAVHLRHYIPLWTDRITLAYHLAWQGTVAGNTPFYLQPNTTMPYLRQVYAEGLGGANTLRGMRQSRIVGDGIVWGNSELRIRLLNFTMLGQNCHIIFNPFFDAGMIVKPYRLEEMKAAEVAAVADGYQEGLIYNGHGDRLHMSAGIGLKFLIERNLVFSAEWGKPFNRKDGAHGTNIGANYIF